MIFSIGLVGAGLGLFVSLYLIHKKAKKKKLFCPLRTKCEKVLHSTHAALFGVPNEYIGVIYYTFLFGLFLVLMSTEALFSPFIHFVLFITILLGSIFSLYLVALQAFTIRAWCFWCLLSTLAHVFLVVTLFLLPQESLFEILGAQRTLWIIIHNTGFILGVGAATLTDIFFFRFLKDNSISDKEKETMDTLTSVIWIGLGILLLTGLALYLPDSERLGVSSKFLLKSVIVGVIVINGLFLTLFISPKLRLLTLEGQTHDRGVRKLAFALGGISIISWYSAFFLGSVRSVPISFSVGVALYGVLIVCVIIGSQLFEYYNNKKDALYTKRGHGDNKII